MKFTSDKKNLPRNESFCVVRTSSGKKIVCKYKDKIFYKVHLVRVNGVDRLEIQKNSKEWFTKENISWSFMKYNECMIFYKLYRNQRFNYALSFINAKFKNKYKNILVGRRW